MTNNRQFTCCEITENYKKWKDTVEETFPIDKVLIGCEVLSKAFMWKNGCDDCKKQVAKWDKEQQNQTKNK